jgi:hypothetical protein
MSSQADNNTLDIVYYALFEGGHWYAAIRFVFAGQRLGEDEVLRESPCKTVEDALKLGREYLQTVVAEGSSRTPESAAPRRPTHSSRPGTIQ